MAELTKPQMRTLGAVARFGDDGAFATDVALALWGFPSAANLGKAAVLLERLEADGYTRRSRASKPRQTVRWFATDKGRTLVTREASDG